MSRSTQQIWVRLVDPAHKILAPGGHRFFDPKGELVELDPHWHQLLADGSIRRMTAEEIAAATAPAAE